MGGDHPLRAGFLAPQTPAGSLPARSAAQAGPRLGKPSPGRGRLRGGADGCHVRQPHERRQRRAPPPGRDQGAARARRDHRRHARRRSWAWPGPRIGKPGQLRQDESGREQPVATHRPGRDGQRAEDDGALSQRPRPGSAAVPACAADPLTNVPGHPAPGDTLPVQRSARRPLCGPAARHGRTPRSVTWLIADAPPRLPGGYPDRRSRHGSAV
jgi:hypothetical protein